MRRKWYAAAMAGVITAGCLLSGCQASKEEAAPVSQESSSEESQTSEIGEPMAETEAKDEETWDAAYDVVVIGFGGAGQSAALAAAQEGANVLILEKTPESAAGGNTRLCGQQILSPTDVDKAMNYFDEIFEGYAYDKDLVYATVEGMHTLDDWLKELAGPTLDLQEIIYPEFSEVEGSETMRCYLIDGERSTGKLWYLLKDCIEERAEQIEVWYESPALELIQDKETKTITGVLASHEGKELRIKAENGVVMACGGYENNQEMIQNYLHMEYAYPKGSYYNTGDGIIMAMKAGADLWHMNNPSGPDLNFKAPDSNAYYGYSLAMDFGSRSTIYVGPDGTRFINESLMTKHGKMPAHGTYQTAATVLPAYAVFDEASFTAGPVTSSGGWSSDNLAELEKGWIVKADTLQELAEQIGVEPSGLEKTVERYNFYCEQKEDYEFGRSADTLIPLNKEGPYYAMELTPTLTNTQGGAVRNANCEVVDLDGYAIPHLYSAGEFGSMFVHGYNGGGNVGEALASGRIAGTNAAKADKTEIPVISNGRESESNTVKEESGINLNTVQTKDGTYVGTGQGMHSEIKAEIVLSNNHLDSVVITQINDTAGICDLAVEQMPDRIVEAQNTQVDAVAGATITSKGIIEAVEDALRQAVE